LQAMRDMPECLRDTFGEGGYVRQLQALEAELNGARSAARGTKSLKEQLAGKQLFAKRMEKKASAADAAGLALQEQLVALNAEIENHRKTVAKAQAEWDTAKTELAVLSARYHAELTLGASSGAAPDRPKTVTLGANVANILQGLCKIVAPEQILEACGGDQQVADSLSTQTAEFLAEAARQLPPPLLAPTANEELQREFEERLEALRKLEEVMAVDSDDESLAPSEAGTEAVDAKSARRKVRSGKRREACASFKAVASKFPKRAAA
jgi:hypothetical protein